MTKNQRAAQESQVGQLRSKGKNIREIMAITGQSYTRVQQTLALAEGRTWDSGED